MSIIKTGFLRGPNGNLYVSVFVPDDQIPLHWVLHVPAFAEEMNKCRPMVARQARALADTGFAVIVPDLFGTGDSDGEFSDADWDQWKNDLKYLIQWAQNQGAEHITLWGVRLGCLLAADVSQADESAVDGLLLWQPVYSGQQHMAQFLRLRMAASLVKGGSESVAKLPQRLLEGESFEVAGYLLTPAMFRQIGALQLADLRFPRKLSIQIFEVISEDNNLPLSGADKQLEQWQQFANQWKVFQAVGDQFWTTQETTFAPSLIQVTTECLASLAIDNGVLLSEGSKSKPELEIPLESRSEHSQAQAVVFSCEAEELVGILHYPKIPAQRGVLIVVGGPQYRVGSHRLFVQLARALTAEGIPVFRFDYRAMGDSSGSPVGFEGVSADIRCAIDIFQREVEGLLEVVIWGLCDAATASIYYAANDPRVKGLVLVNPWVYSTHSAARVVLRHYYPERLFSRSFWAKVFTGQYNPFTSAFSLMDIARMALRPNVSETAVSEEERPGISKRPSDATAPLLQRFTDSMELFKGNILVILSGNDLTAAEFKGAAAHNRKLQKLLMRPNVRQQLFIEADHTFTQQECRLQVEKATIDWYRGIAERNSNDQ